MLRIACLMLLSLALVWLAGCEQGQPDLRTFEEARDGDAAIAKLQPEVETPEQPASAEPTLARAAPVPDESPQPSEAVTASTAPSPELVEETSLPRPPRAPLPERIADATSGEGDAQLAMATAAEQAKTKPEDAGPREIKLLVPEKDFMRVKPDASLRVSYDDLDLLKVLNMEPVPEDAPKHFPSWLTELDGQQIRIRGFMVPPSREEGLSGFILARDNQICCFGRDPKVYDIIPVFLKEGVTTKYIPNRPFDVVGKFYIRPDAYRGVLENLYEIEDAVILDE